MSKTTEKIHVNGIKFFIEEKEDKCFILKLPIQSRGSSLIFDLHRAFVSYDEALKCSNVISKMLADFQFKAKMLYLDGYSPCRFKVLLIDSEEKYQFRMQKFYDRRFNAERGLSSINRFLSSPFNGK